MRMKAHVDKSTCVGCGMCVGACREAYRMGADRLAEGGQEIPPQSVDDALQAAEDCPAGAIKVK